MGLMDSLKITTNNLVGKVGDVVSDTGHSIANTAEMAKRKTQSGLATLSSGLSGGKKTRKYKGGNTGCGCKGIQTGGKRRKSHKKMKKSSRKHKKSNKMHKKKSMKSHKRKSHKRKSHKRKSHKKK